jgi:hypothetical protein
MPNSKRTIQESFVDSDEEWLVLPTGPSSTVSSPRLARLGQRQALPMPSASHLRDPSSLSSTRVPKVLGSYTYLTRASPLS